MRAIRIRFCSRISELALLSLLIIPGSLGNCEDATAKSTSVSRPSSAHLSLVWSDEFNGTSGTLPNPKKWKVIVDNSGFGNRELEYYTDRTTNVRQANNHLVIQARKEDHEGKDGVSRDYTSGRIESAGRFQIQYGRVEARIKIPSGQGIWPAFWMLGNNFPAVAWPECGEIDIMENVGFEPSKIHGSLHGPGYSGSNPLSGVYTLPNKARFSDDFHRFAIEWEPKEIRFYIDDILYQTQTLNSVPPGKRWAFDHPFYIVLNVAVGGYWPGDPDKTTQFPAEMLVDYVRVYQFDASHK